MSNGTSPNAYRCLFFGMPCTFSAPTLAALSHPPIELVGIVTPAPRLIGASFRVVKHAPARMVLPVQSDHLWVRPSIDLPHYLVRTMRDPELIRALIDLEPDLIIVACFPWLIPTPVIQSARIASLNVHPSLLPSHGGPDPLFWTFHAGEEETGVSVHHLTNRFDAGPVMLRAPSPVFADESLADLDHRLAVIGAELIAIIIEGLPQLPTLPLIDPSFASYEHKPTGADLIIHPEWTVERARRFIAGVAQSHGPLYYQLKARQAMRIAGLSSALTSVEIVLANGTLRVHPAV